MIPPGSRFTCAEVNHPEKLAGLLEAHPYLKGCRIITDSDAHSLGNISEPEHTLHFETDHPSPEEVLEVLKSVE